MGTIGRRPAKASAQRGRGKKSRKCERAPWSRPNHSMRYNEKGNWGQTSRQAFFKAIILLGDAAAVPSHDPTAYEINNKTREGEKTLHSGAHRKTHERGRSARKTAPLQRESRGPLCSRVSASRVQQGAAGPGRRVGEEVARAAIHKQHGDIPRTRAHCEVVGRAGERY